MKTNLTGFWWPMAMLWLFLTTISLAAPVPPRTNPAVAYKQFKAWTSTVNWKNVINAATVPSLIDANNHLDSARLAAVLAGLAKNNGGVLYFPAGTYYLNFNLPLFNRVIIRGDQSSLSKDKAQFKDDWPTKFIFSKLVANRRNVVTKGDDIASIDPRFIFNASKNATVIGIVDIDLNRASVIIDGAKHTNVLLQNVRINNASLLDPLVPTSKQLSTQHGDQRWPDRSKGVVDIHTDGDALIAGCIINDDPSDNFVQNDYTLDDGMRFDGTEAMFRFSDHPAVRITGQVRKAQVIIKNNRFYVTKGNAPVLFNSTTWIPVGQASVIEEEPRMLLNGRDPVNRNYDLIAGGKVHSDAKSYRSKFGEVLNYRLIKPANYDSTKAYPLIVFFHDAWERGSDNKNQTRQLIWQFFVNGNENKYPCFILAPQLPLTEARWKCEGLDVETWTARLTKEIIDQEVKAYNINTKKIYCIGESLGAAGAIDMAVQFPDTFAALVPISGFYRFTKNSALQLRNIPVWLIYGAKDDKLRPIEKYNPRLALETAKVDLKFSDFPDAGHRCWNSLTIKHPEFLPWLFAQVRK